MVCNLLVNLYKCLVFGYEVLCYIVWSGKNCLLLICVLFLRGLLICIEVCLVDLVVNLYMVLVVILEVGLDGIKNKLKVLEFVN